MKQILLRNGGLRSTVERRNFWVYRTKINAMRSSYGIDFYSKLLVRCAVNNETTNIEIMKDIGRTFPEL